MIIRDTVFDWGVRVDCPTVRPTDENNINSMLQHTLYIIETCFLIRRGTFYKGLKSPKSVKIFTKEMQNIFEMETLEFPSNWESSPTQIVSIKYKSTYYLTP